MTKRKLLFQNPVFHEGINVTVRHGLAWADSLDEEPLVYHSDFEAENDYLGWAHIKGVLTCRLFQIPPGVLTCEHDPSCRTKKGILAEMVRVYGDVTEISEVTVLFFTFRAET